MSQYITDTTQLKCDKGASPAPLTVTSQSFMSIDGKLQATEEDKQPNSNIKPFGVCSVLRSSCTPSPVKWDNTSDFEIDGKKELLDK
ncbi:PAAR-like protein [Chryseobacterium tructae]|uniref:PAAR-like protein n=1 Tax=Chryseobacterium tructae TaxID=1037380 RepID=A0ABV7Y253_9FLAO|nr:PAAR-like protein [Chryseobacterium tructae]MDN3693787.1 PAAR-like protein [Chryseobacterium tructae]